MNIHKIMALIFGLIAVLLLLFIINQRDQDAKICDLKIDRAVADSCPFVSIYPGVANKTKEAGPFGPANMKSDVTPL